MENKQYYQDLLVNHSISMEESEKDVRTYLKGRSLQDSEIDELFAELNESAAFAHDVFIGGKTQQEVKALLVEKGWSVSSAGTIVHKFSRKKRVEDRKLELFGIFIILGTFAFGIFEAYNTGEMDLKYILGGAAAGAAIVGKGIAGKEVE